MEAKISFVLQGFLANFICLQLIRFSGACLSISSAIFEVKRLNAWLKFSWFKGRLFLTISPRQCPYPHKKFRH